MTDPYQQLLDDENRYDSLPPALRNRVRDPIARRKLELEGIVAQAEAELARVKSLQQMARERGHKVQVKFLEIERTYYQDRLNLASVLLEREQFTEDPHRDDWEGE